MLPTQDFSNITELSPPIQLKVLNPVAGRILNFFGKAVKILGPDNTYSYVKPESIAEQLLGDRAVSSETKELVTKRIIEITKPLTTQPLSLVKLDAVFKAFAADQAQGLEKEDEIISELEKIKLQLNDIRPIVFEEKLSEIKDQLQPGDFLIRKYHEKHDNLICTLQHFFRRNGYSEAYKCSHIAVYLGEVNGKPWIAEASMPHENEVEVRRIELDDPRFAPRDMNQYIIVRNNNPEEASRLAQLAKDYTVKMWPADEATAPKEDVDNTFRYNFLEAARSLWHLSNLGPYGRHRLLKYYSDYKNNIPFEYLGNEKGFFCSHFALVMESLAEMDNSEKFQNFIKAHPTPKLYDETKSGIALKISKLWYSVRKGIWARAMAVRYKSEIKESLHTHLDPLRSSPQDTVVYMMQNPNQYTIVGQIIHHQDYPKFNPEKNENGEQ